MHQDKTPKVYTTRSKSGREPTGGDLKDGISYKEGTENPAQLLIADTVLFADLQRSDGDVGPVQKRNAAENKEPESQEITDVGASLGKSRRCFPVRWEISQVSRRSIRLSATIVAGEAAEGERNSPRPGIRESLMVKDSTQAGTPGFLPLQF